MDESEKYIKMCKKAEEIQKYHQSASDWDNGEYFAYPIAQNKYYIRIFSQCGYYGEGEFEEDDLQIWLPTQADLQDMLKEDYAGNIIMQLFYFYMNNDISRNYSMEQILLLYVMRKKYDKIWDTKKENWITFAKKKRKSLTSKSERL